MTPVTHDPIDAGRLADYLRDHVDGFESPPTLARLSGGQSNPTYRVEARGRTYALRTKPGPEALLLPSAHQIEREFRVLSALSQSDVPVPRVYHLCRNEEVIGRAFYLMDFVPGKVFVDPRLPTVTADERQQLFDDMNRVIAALHATDWRSLGLGDFGKPGLYLSRQIARWSRQYRASETEQIEAMDCLMAWLPEHVPEDDSSTLLHGDFRLDNLIFDEDKPRIAAVLDWELSTIGSPLADFAYHCCVWHFPSGLYRGLGDVVAPAGIPSESDYRARYTARCGYDTMAHWDYYVAYNFFRMAAIVQGIRKRVLSGTAAADNAEEFGRGARRLAEMGWARAQRMA